MPKKLPTGKWKRPSMNTIANNMEFAKRKTVNDNLSKYEDIKE